jgi:AraC-like DNA-binding protein
VRDAYRRAVIRYVRDHLADPELGTTRLAAALHLSPRYVQVLMSELGTTVRDHVRAQRLAEARSPVEHSSRAIGDIAHQCGFANFSTFSTQFKMAYGITPREARAAVAVAASLPPSNQAATPIALQTPADNRRDGRPTAAIGRGPPDPIAAELSRCVRAMSF